MCIYAYSHMHTYGNMLLTGTLLWLALYQQSPCCFFIQAPKGDAVYLRLAEDPASLYFLPLMPTLCSSRSSNSLWMFREKTTVSAAWSVMGVSRYQTRERALPNLLRYRSFLCICLSWCYQIWTGHTRIQDQVNYSYKSPKVTTHCYKFAFSKVMQNRFIISQQRRFCGLNLIYLNPWK